MPKINRIRIINFLYNNDNREIQDETYKFFDGENALLNLSNGGGKSVLIQLFLQPVIPDLKIQNRPMADYIKKNASPVFIMIEWLLDNKTRKDYLLTGIVIAPRGTGNEDSNKINYFTFISHYDKAFEFDISSVPFVKNEQGRLHILPYERSREAVKGLAGKHREVFYYNRDDGMAYRNQLMNFGISQEEWKNIIAKMNNDEGGIDKLFERCAASNIVFNEWILKTVEKSILSGQAGGVQIYELLDGLVLETLKNESYIRDQELMEAYFIDHQKLEGQLLTVCERLEAYEQLKRSLSGMYEKLIRQKRRFAIDLEEIKIEQQELNAEKLKINQEERSENYYKAQEDFNFAVEAYNDEEQLLSEYIERIKQNQYEQKLQKAAKLYENGEKLRADIEVLEKQLKNFGKDDKNFNHLLNLKYSLRLSFNERIKILEAECNESEDKKATNQKEIYDVEEAVNKLNEESGNLNLSLGGVNEKLKSFELYEQQISKKINIHLTRNVFKEIPDDEIKAVEIKLKNDIDMFKEALAHFIREKEELRRLLERLNQEKSENLERKAKTELMLGLIEQELSVFKKQEGTCILHLEQYAIERELLYQKERLIGIFDDKTAELKNRKSSWELEKAQIHQMIEGIKQNYIYLPKVLLRALSDADVDFTTGEEYLKNLPENNRLQLLDKNPVLPFSIIIKSGDRNKIFKQHFDHLFLCQVVPFITYEQLDDILGADNQIVEVSSSLSLLGAYERRLFIDSEMTAYLKELEHQHNTIVESIKHTDKEIANIYKVRNALEEFNYSQSYESGLIDQISNLKRKKDECTEHDDELKQQINQLNEKLTDLDKSIDDSKTKLENTDRRFESFCEFVEKNKDYMMDYSKYTKLLQQKQEQNKLYNELNVKQKKLREAAIELKGKHDKLSASINDTKDRAAAFHETPDAEKLDGTLEYLMQQYETLNQQISKNMASIEISLKDKRKRHADITEELDDLELPLCEYMQLIYDKEQERMLRKAEEEIGQHIDQQRTKGKDALNRKGKAEATLETAVSRLKEIGLSLPLAQAAICQNYENRRKILKIEQEKLENKNTKIKEKSDLYILISSRIENLVSVREIDALADFQLEEDEEKQFNKLKSQYTDSEAVYKKAVNTYKKLHESVKTDYDNKHQCITDILDSLKTLDLNDYDISYDKLYFYVEEFIKKKENLKKLLDFYDIQLMNIAHTKRQIIDQCISFSMLIYEDIKRIIIKSRIRLSSKSRPVQMLKIDIPESLDSQINERMTAYIENSLRIMVEMSKADTDRNNKKYKEKMRELMTTRELFNQLIGTGKIQVSVYKIDLNPNNSGMKKWEEAMAQNSGGEKFVVFFTMVSTLISYTREAEGRNTGTDMSQDSKVILMDNPFAKTSSEHLLKAVVDIAKTFNIQLICLSDLSQSSITNRFALIYQLAVRKKMYSDKEVLKTRNVQVNKEDLKENEKLEHAGLYASYEQGDLFDYIGFR